MDLNKQDNQKRTALHYAIMKQHRLIIQELMNRHAKIDVSSSFCLQLTEIDIDSLASFHTIRLSPCVNACLDEKIDVLTCVKGRHIQTLKNEFFLR